MLEPNTGSPASQGFSMPPEWSAHAECLMQWPAREDLWGERLADAQHDYAIVARAIAAFEPVTMICSPGQVATVRDRCGADVESLELDIDDSWARDNGPIFVRDERGALAVVDFGFNAWGERWHPYDHDAAGRPGSRTTWGCRSSMHRSCSRADRSSSTARARSSPPNSAC